MGNEVRDRRGDDRRRYITYSTHSGIPLTSLLDPDPTILWSTPGRTIQLRNGGLVAKWGVGVTEDERAALEYGRKKLGLPFPRVHDYESPDPRYACIWMDQIEGRTLEEVWPNMDEDQKKNIATQLRDILARMRSHQSDTGRIESCNGGPVRDLRYIKDYIGGPFPDETSFNDFLLNLYDTTPIEVRDDLANGLRSDHCIFFTHGDLSQLNIIVNDDNEIQALVDLEYGGWYPEYWEYVRFMNHAGGKYSADWKRYAGYIFSDQYHDELHAYRALRDYRSP